jgi:hypothetical protein
MSTDYSQQQQNSSNGGGAGSDGSNVGDAGGDLATQLAGGTESEFVVGEEKKPATQGLIFLAVLVLIGVGGTYFMYMRQGPSTAAAASTPEAQKAEQTINTFLTSGPDGIKMMHSMLKDTEKVVKQFLEYPSVTQIPLASLHTNPFQSQPTKPDGKPADPDEKALERQREAEKQAALKASEELKLQSIIYSGSRKACMINNTLYKEGEQIEQFTIEKIEPGRVIVKTGAYRFELKAKR